MSSNLTTLFGYGQSVTTMLPEKIGSDFDLSTLTSARAPLSEWVGNVEVETIDTEALLALAGCVDLTKNRSDTEKNALDAWLAPRLHASLRVSRRVASSPEFWRWVALELASPIVIARFRDGDGVSKWRYTGKLFRNAISRLWWAAEMVRNGSDYSLVAHTFGRTRTAQFALELGYSHYPPAAMGFVRVAEGRDGGPKLDDSQMNNLSVAINALLSTRVLEACDLGSKGSDYDTGWWTAKAKPEEVLSGHLPVGPLDGRVEDGVLGALTRWFRDLVTADDLAAIQYPCEDHPVEGEESEFQDPASLPALSGSADSDFVNLHERHNLDEEPDSDENIDYNERYLELPLPEGWRPLLVTYAPGAKPEPLITPVDGSRIYDAFTSANLQSRSNRILLQRFLGGRTLERIGHDHDLTRERIRQLQVSALRKIKRALVHRHENADDLLRVMSQMEATSFLVLPATARSRLLTALASEFLPDAELYIRREAGFLFVLGGGFQKAISQLEDDVASRSEFVESHVLAVAHGISGEAVKTAVYLSDRLYVDSRGRIGSRAWTKTQQMETVAWLLALSTLEVTRWHASELGEALKVVFPADFKDWRARHVISTLSRPGYTAFSHVGKAGHWALAEAIQGPSTTLEAVKELLEQEGSKHVDEILNVLIKQGRDVRKATLWALMTTNRAFIAVGDGRFWLRE